MLEHGVEVEYFDHHFSGAIPEHPSLRPYIDTTPEICTSLLVDRHLTGQHRLWAIVGAYGDNLLHAAGTLAENRTLQPEQVEQLRELGESINSNSYGDTEADLLIPPARLYEVLRPYSDPFNFVMKEPIAQALRDARTWNWHRDCSPMWISHAERSMCCQMSHGHEGCVALSATSWRQAFLIALTPC